jgi:exodeoxyribonuclease VII small subunit
MPGWSGSAWERSMTEETINFEESFQRLQETIAALEQGGLPLDVAIDQFENAIQIAGKCRELLDKAELRVTKLVETELIADDYVDIEDED